MIGCRSVFCNDMHYGTLSVAVFKIVQFDILKLDTIISNHINTSIENFRQISDVALAIHGSLINHLHQESIGIPFIGNGAINVNIPSRVYTFFAFTCHKVETFLIDQIKKCNTVTLNDFYFADDSIRQSP